MLRRKFATDNLLDEQVIEESVLGNVNYIYKTDKKGRPVHWSRKVVFGDVEK